jgi:hypothetical protein
MLNNRVNQRIQSAKALLQPSAFSRVNGDYESQNKNNIYGQ